MVLQPQERVISTGSLIRNRWRSSCGDRWLSPALTISDVRQLVHFDKNICPQVSLNQIVQPTRRHLYWVIHNMTETKIFQRCRDPGQKHLLRVQMVESHTHNLGHLAVSQLCRKQDKTSELEALMVIMHQERAIITGSLIRNRWRSGCGYGWSNTARTISGILAVGQLWRKTISHNCTHTKFPSRHAGIWIGSSTARLRKESLGMPRPGQNHCAVAI